MTNYLATPTSTQVLPMSNNGLTVNFDTNWRFDESTKLAFCYDSGTSTVQLTCFVRTFLVWFGWPSMGTDLMNYMWGATRKRIYLSFEFNVII